jgi:hypothetical protein
MHGECHLHSLFQLLAVRLLQRRGVMRRLCSIEEVGLHDAKSGTAAST